MHHKMALAKSLALYFCAFIVINISLGNPISEEDQHFRNYIKNIKSQIDENVKPCENFGKYACGNFKEPEHTNLNTTVTELVEKHLVNKEPQNDIELKAKNLYLSCKNRHDIKDMFKEMVSFFPIKKWPVTEDYSDSDIAELAGNLAVFDFQSFISLDLPEFTTNNNLFIYARKLLTEYEMEQMPTLLELFGGSAEENLKIVENVKNINEQIIELRKISEDNEPSTFENINELKKAVPNFDWDSYFNAFAKKLDLEIKELYAQKLKVGNVEYMKKVLDLIKTADSKAIVNSMALKYVSPFVNINCEKVLTLFVPMLLAKDNKDKLERTLDHGGLKHLEVVHEFEKNYNNIKSQLNHPENPQLEQYIGLKKKFIQYHDSLLSGKYLEPVFANVQINEKTYYDNCFKLILAGFKDIMKNGENSLIFIFEEFVEPRNKNSLKNMNKPPKPLLYYFVTTGTNLWTTMALLDDTYENRTINEACLPYKNKEDSLNTHNNMKYLTHHAGFSLSVQGYLKYVSEHKEEFKGQTEMLTELGLDHAKAFMLALAQHECTRTNQDHLEDTNLLSFLKHSKTFSDAWTCSAGDGMYNSCDDSSFVMKI